MQIWKPQECVRSTVQADENERRWFCALEEQEYDVAQNNESYRVIDQDEKFTKQEHSNC